MLNNTESLLLPFTVPPKNREVTSNESIELAAIFCLAELERDKGGGLIFKKPPEELFFISKVYYPFWLAPWDEKTLLFDGLGLISHTVSFNILPDLDIYISGIRGSANNREAYIDFLSSNLNYFKIIGEGKKPIKGLITDPEFKRDFFSLISRSKPVKGTPRNNVLLPLLIDKLAVETILNDLSNFRRSLAEDIKSLQRVENMIIEVTQKHIDAIKREIDETNKMYEGEIAELKSKCMKRIEEESEKIGQKIAEVSEKVNRLIQDINQKRADLEASKRRLTIYIEQCKNEISMAKSYGDKTREEFWRRELEKKERELSVINESFKEVEKNINDARFQADLEISKLRLEYNSKVEAIMADLERAKIARDFKINNYQQMINSLNKSASAIIGQIDRLIELRKLTLSDIEKITYPEKREKYAIAYLPFFLLCYRRGLEKRYVAFPPSIVNTLNGAVKVKGLFRPFKVRALLQEFSASITSLLNLFIDLIERDPIFEDSVKNACVGKNILKDFNEEIREGLKSLFENKWLSEKDLKSFMQSKSVK
ncbi:MAG: hypothetical protein QXS10_06715 [Candidatus Bathyarchaeia archaeon]